jgi:hypothetical protein
MPTKTTLHYLALLVCISYSQLSSAGEAVTTIGWIESVKILPEAMELKAKIDTGADNSSLGVVEWQSYTHDDEEWIRFTVVDDHNSKQVFERPLDRYTHIKRKQEKSLKRPVVKMWLCIDKRLLLVPVNLSKREQFQYRMLIGRSLLSGNFLVNSAAIHTTSPECTSPQ